MCRALLLVVAVAISACAQVTLSPSPTAAVSVAVTPPTPSPSPATAALQVSVHILEQCGSEGGCAFYAELVDGEGQISSENLGFGSRPTSGLPDRLPLGTYTLTFRSSLVSDIILNGAPPGETPDVACKTRLEVVSGQERITAVGVFRADSCEILVTTS